MDQEQFTLTTLEVNEWFSANGDETSREGAES